MSIKFRFVVTLTANSLKTLVTIVTTVFLARELGPGNYGVFAYLLGSFLAIKQVLDMGGSTAFYTLVSQRTRSHKFILCYWIWLVIILIFTAFVIGILLSDDLINEIWPKIDRFIVAISFVSVYLQYFLWQIVVQMGETVRRTLLVQLVGVFVSVCNLLLLLFLWYVNLLELKWIFTVLIIEWVLAIGLTLCVLRFPFDRTNQRINEDVGEFFSILAPLIPYAWIACAYEFVDKWLLQNYGGPENQAFYSTALQFSAIAALATTSIVNIFWGEISKAYASGNSKLVEELTSKISRLLYALAACCAGFLAPWSAWLVELTFGREYVDSAPTFAIMIFYPVHQSLGQIVSTLAYGVGSTKMLTKVGSLMMLIGMPISYILTAHQDSFVPGLELGALGIAIKMVLLQIVSVNVLGYYLAKSLNIKIYWKYQVLAILSFCAIGFLSYFVATGVSFFENNAKGDEFIVSGFIYAGIVFFILRFKPDLLGIPNNWKPLTNFNLKSIK